LAHFHEQYAEHVLALAVAHAPKAVAPPVALDQLRAAGPEQSRLQRLRAELLPQQRAHDVDLDLFPIGPQVDVLASLLRPGGTRFVADAASLILVERLGGLVGVLDRAVRVAVERDAA